MLALGAMIGTWAAAMAVIYTLFTRADRHLRLNSREVLSRWLRGEVAPNAAWAEAFKNLFDSLFRVREFGWLPFPSFLRSCLASIIALILCFAAWLSFFPPRLGICGYIGWRSSCRRDPLRP